MLLTIATHSSIVLQDKEPDSNQLQGLEKATEESVDTQMRRTVENLAEAAQSTNINSFSNASANLSKKGSYKGINQPVSLERFSNKTRNLSNKIEELQINITDVKSENFTISVDSSTRISFASLAQVQDTSTEFEINNVSDTLLSRYGYNSNISRCSYTKFANKIGSGSNVNGTARGDPEVTPSSLSPDSREVLVTTDVTQYSTTDVTNYAGFISSGNPSNPSTYNQNYVTGLPSLPSFKPLQRVLLHENPSSSNSGAWKSNIYSTISSGCYIPTSIKSAPSVEERIENKSRGVDEDGLVTIINASSLGTDSSESNIGFERVDKPSDLVEIEGVSEGEGVIKNYFRVNRSTAQSVGLQPLIK